MTHFHAGWTFTPGQVFGTERDARAHLAAQVTSFAHYLVTSDEWEDCNFQQCSDQTVAILTGAGTVTDNGHEWASDFETYWMDRCDKPECGSWNWEPALAS